ncbi:electron transport complex subunit RsxB [Desulfosporosinus acididurans]|uniref:Ferredoxin n=1 Tax=Desulfosporosinus acididurans TaxID=476652 RepID=A0A0J1FS45_9FIRM|nr:4Fe-4S binding protein [Desulfosporosinus acididurans]KLU66304.1 electron transport complex subunit RsxB [Desulfosporosinus acididurans]
MSVTILKHCPGCGKCVRPGVCPTNAIAINDGKAVIGEGCIECGLCISACPIGLIKAEKKPAEVKKSDGLKEPEEIKEPKYQEDLSTEQNREEEQHEQTSTGS